MLISAAEVADMLGVSATDTLLVRLVKSVDGWAKGECLRDFERQVRTEIVRGSGKNQVIVRESPIIAITEVRFDQTGIFGSSSSSLDPTLFTFDSDPLNDDPTIYYATGCFPYGPRTVRMKIEAGFWPASPSSTFDANTLNTTLAPTNTPAAPEDIRDALIDLVVAKYKQGPNEKMQSEAQGDVSWTRFAGGLDPMLLSTVRRYTRYR